MKHQTVFKISNKSVGLNRPPFIIAELSGNHNGDLSRAIKLIELAAEAGVDAIKLQTYTADTLTLDHDGPEFMITDGPWKGRRLYDLYQEAHTPWDWHPQLFVRAKELGLIIFSSPFDETAVDFLEELDCPAYKIASFECIDTPLILKCSQTKKPLIISTGLANQIEISEAVKTATEGGATGIALLHCVSAYPANSKDYNLRTIPFLQSTYNIPIGLSDHSPGTATAVASIPMGACIIEKHLTLSRQDGGVDSSFSLEPHELKQLVNDCRLAWESMGEIKVDAIEAEKDNILLRPSLYVTKNIKKGEKITPENVRSIRPGFGLPPNNLPKIIGLCATRDLFKGTALTWKHVQN